MMYPNQYEQRIDEEPFFLFQLLPQPIIFAPGSTQIREATDNVWDEDEGIPIVHIKDKQHKVIRSLRQNVPPEVQIGSVMFFIRFIKDFTA